MPNFSDTRRIKYEDYNPRSKAKQLIQRCRNVLDEYRSEGMDLTLRQLFYQMVSRDFLPNTSKEYERLGRIVSRARRAGLLDWNMIVDRNRRVRRRTRWDDPQHIIENSAESYHIDLWQDQRVRVEVYIEKTALVDVIAGPCRELDVPYFACVGYSSDTAIWQASQRYIEMILDGPNTSLNKAAHPRYNHDVYQVPVILHLSDHDPSGMDMTRDLRDKLELFGAPVPVRRIGLTMDQIQSYELPPDPAKPSDTRYKDYIKEHGRQSWELDALPPQVLRQLVRKEIEALVEDQTAFSARIEQREEERAQLRRVAKRWRDLLE